jgi:hypothetical protein
VPDRPEGGTIPRRAPALAGAAVLAAAALSVACQTLEPASPPPVPPDGGTPCSRAVAVAADTVVIAAGACIPWCIAVPAGTEVTFQNNDPVLYYLVADPPLPYDVQVPAYAGMATLPLPVGTYTWTAVQNPATTVTIFVE